MSSNYCGSLTPCSVYYTQYPFINTYNNIYSWEFQITTGLNSIYLPQPVIVSQGYFITMTQTSGKVAIDTTGIASYSDMALGSIIWNQLSPASNWRFYLTAMTNFTSYQTSFSISHAYKSLGLYNISLRMLSSGETFQQTINITDSLFIFF